jgi:predicted chitinase
MPKNNEYDAIVITETGVLDSNDSNDEDSILYSGAIKNTKAKKKKVNRVDTIPIITDPFDSEKCICQLTITPEIFKQCMDIKIDKLFGGYNMGKTFETYKLETQIFLDNMFEMWEKHNINNCRRKAHYLGQAWLETDNFNTLVEYVDGTQYNPGRHPKAKENGNTLIGDGPKYRGRGCMQLTWKNNYKAYTKYLKDNNLSTDDLVAKYELVTSSIFHSIYSSGWFWEFGKVKGNGDIINLNDLSDELKIDRISVLVNGGGNGRAERKKITENTLNFFNYKKCINYHK